MGSHSVTYHPTEVTFLHLPQPIKAGRFCDPRGKQGWVNLPRWYTCPQMVIHPNINRVQRTI